MIDEADLNATIEELQDHLVDAYAEITRLRGVAKRRERTVPAV